MKKKHPTNIKSTRSGWNEDQIKTEPFNEESQLESEIAIAIASSEEAEEAVVVVSIQPEPYIHTGQHSDIGTHRNQNEDTTMSIVSLCGGEIPLVPLAISLVADGMGGHANGADASRSVGKHIIQNLISRIFIPLMNNLSVTEPVQSIMRRAVQDASKVIRTDDSEQLGGTTLTCGVIIKSRLFLAHVGDSRAYLYDDSSIKMKQLTQDHTYVQQLINNGEITIEEAAVHPQRNLLYRAITGAEVEVEMFTCQLPRAGTLIVCSDGLWGSVTDSAIQSVVSNKDLMLQQKCEQLVALAIDGGATDNISVVLTEFRL